MRDRTAKKIISVLIMAALLVSQIIPVFGADTNVRFEGGPGYASCGKTNCYPDKGNWSTDLRNGFYIEAHPDTGDEIKPTDINKSFSYQWSMPLKGIDAQTKDGLIYKVKLQVFGQLLDGDVASIFLNFWGPREDGYTGATEVGKVQENFNFWNDVSFSGYVPEGATAMLLTLSGQKAYGALEDDDCAIYFRNIEVYIIDEIPPAPVGIEFGERRELGTPEMRRMKDYYGIGEDVYWDVEFNEPVYINDPEYLAYVRHLLATQGNDDELYKFLKMFMKNLTVLEFIEKRLTDQFPKDTAILEHVRQNNGRTVEQQFGKLRLKFKYRNSDGEGKTGYAEVVDKSLYNKETYGNDYSKQIKFRYAIRPGDAFKAENIYEMTLEGGIITDNSFNAMSDSCRIISFDSKSGDSLNTIYRKYTRNFNVETSPPVLLEINGGEPDGKIDQFTKLKLYFKFNEPVYITLSDDAFIEHDINKLEFNKDSISNRITLALASVSLNSQFRYQNGYSWISDNSLGPPVAYYSGGNGTSLLAFSYYVRETDFDPLEITGSDFEMYGGSHCGEIYVMDAAGNKAPLLQNKNIKLSDKKLYIADREPPEVTVQRTEAEDGFYVKIDARDEGSGVDYDSLSFSVGYPDSPASEMLNNMKILAPGRKYHSGELSKMFGLDPGKGDTLRIAALAKDRSENYLCNDMGGWYWYTDIRNDNALFTLIGCDVDKDKYSTNHGHFNARIGYGSSKIPDAKYKWVSEGFNPDTEDWLQASTYDAGSGQFNVSGSGPSVYIFGGADLYLKASDPGGNEKVFCIPEALEYKDLYYMEGDVEFSFTGPIYICKAVRYAFRGSGINKGIKGLWYCLSEEGTAPEFPGNSGLWKYKAGDSVQAFEYDTDPKERKGWYFMHVIAVCDDDKPIGRATSPDMMFYNFDKGKIVVESERMGDGSIVVRPSVISDFIRRKDFRVEYDINNLFNVHDWKRLPDNGEIVLGRELLNPRAGLEIRAIGPDGSEIKYGGYFGDGTGGINNPSVLVNLHNRYGDKSYTNENFAELITDTEADEFSYSLDGSSWSSWLPLKKGNTGADYGNSVLYVSLPQREGEITFYTKYRKVGMGISDAIKSSVIRDMTPPTGKVEYSSYEGSDYWFNAMLKGLSDNLCPGQAVEVIGDKDKIISVDEPEYFLIKDVAGNMAEVRAYKKADIPPVVQKEEKESHGSSDTTPPVITISPDGSFGGVKEVSIAINVTDSSAISKIMYAFSTDSNPPAAGWTETANNSTVGLSGVTGQYYLHVKAEDSAGNTGVFRSETYHMDSTDPIISIEPDGAAGERVIISPEIKVADDSSITELSYAFSDKSDSEEMKEADWTTIIHKPAGNKVSLSGVSGAYYLHVKAKDAAGNEAVKTSNPYSMIMGDTKPYVVFSGELEGEMKAYIVSPEPITVSKAVYGGLTMESPGYEFSYEYEDGTPGSIEGEFDEWGDPLAEWKGTVGMVPDDRATSEEVTVTISAPTELDPGIYSKADIYGEYDEELEFEISEHSGDGTLNGRLVSTETEPGESGSIRIIEGFIGEWDHDTGEYNIETDLTGEFITDELLAEGIHIFKAEVTVNENGLVVYNVGDGEYGIKIGHIVEPELEDNVTTVYINKVWAYNPKYLLASANTYVAYATMAKAGSSLSGADITPPSGRVTYTSLDPKKGPVTADLKLSDDSGGRIIITNNGGNSRYVFNENGQFLFGFVDEAGNKGRALAEVKTIISSCNVKVSYSTKLPTNGNVKVTMNPEAGVKLKSGDIQTVQEGSSYSFNAEGNGQWKFLFANESGTEESVIASVANIDRIPPKLYVDYVKDIYNKTITAFVKSDEQIWIKDGNLRSHVFRTPGEYIMKAEDEAGNEAAITAKVSDKDFEVLGVYKSDINVNIRYSTDKPTNKPVRITLTSDRTFTVLNNNGNKDREVTRNGKYQFVVKDEFNMIKIVEAEVKNIDTEAPLITLGYPDNMTFFVGDTVNLMNFIATDNFDGDITGRAKVEGNVNTRRPGNYTVTYRVSDSSGNTAIKVLNARVLESGEPVVSINGVRCESEPLIFDTDRLSVSAAGFTGKTSIKWAKGYEETAFFKSGGTVAAGDSITTNEKGWYTLHIYDSERNSILIHVLINSLGGERQ